MAISDLFRRKDEPESPDTRADRAEVQPTKALPRFLASLGARDQPVLLDLGPVVGSNVTFFGEHLGCKIHVEDVFKDVDQHARDGSLDQLPAFFAQRFPQAAESVDGILCWDLFDYLDKPAAQVLARELTRILRTDGSLLAFFRSTDTPPPGPATYTKHIVVDPATVKHRSYPAARGKSRAWLNRDIIRMFEPLRVAEQFLLKTNLREVLFRKSITHSA